MKLQTLERMETGFKIHLADCPETTPIEHDGTNWLINTEWVSASDTIRTTLISVLFESRAKLFKTSPTLKTLENLLSPWVVVDECGNFKIQCELPSPNVSKPGKGTLELTAVLIKRDGIQPVWAVKSYSENTPVVDFDWEDASPENEIREVTLIESEVPLEAGVETLHLNTDEEYNARKFAAKERVREARLKAILSRRAAEVETQRYYDEFNLIDNESTFSEYDISEFSESEGEDEKADQTEA
jgi:hypothetical protein